MQADAPFVKLTRVLKAAKGKKTVSERGCPVGLFAMMDISISLLPNTVAMAPCGCWTVEVWLVWLDPGDFPFHSVQFSSVQSLSRVWLCNPMDCSMPGLPVHHQLPEFTQTHVHWVSDAIQPSHPLSSPSPPTFNLSQHQGLFKWVSSPFH